MEDSGEFLIDLGALTELENGSNEDSFKLEIETDEANTTEDPKTGTEEEEKEPESKTETDQNTEAEEKETVLQRDSSSKEVLKKVLGDSYTIDVPGEDGELVSKSLDELVLTDDEVTNLLIDYVEREKQLASENKVSMEGVSDVVKRIMDIEKAGGDITTVLRLQEQYINPLNSLDTTTTKGQKEVLWFAYKATGRPDDEIDILIQGFELKGELEEKAIAAETALREQVKTRQENEVKQAEEAAKERKAKLQEYKKDAKEHLQNMKVKESVMNKAIKALSTEGPKGKYEIISELEKALSDPQTAAELAVFVLNREEYNSITTQNKVKEVRLEEGKKLLLRRSTTTQKVTETSNPDKGEIHFDNL